MSHPEILKMNANLYYNEILKTAENYRRARNIRNRESGGSLLKGFFQRWQTPDRPSLKRAVHPQSR